MIKVMRTALGLIGLGLFVIFMMSAMPVQKGRGLGQGPVIKRLSSYRGDHFPGFAEFRVQNIEYGDLGEVILQGEPYDILMNVTYITTAYRFEDVKETDYSTMVFTNYREEPILIRQPYKDVVSSIRKGMEALTK
jgi:hypothetical protein